MYGMYGHHIYLAQYVMDQGKVANPARGQLKNKKIDASLSSFAPENLISRDGFGRPAPRFSLACSFSTLRLNLVLTHGISPDFHGGVH